MSDVAIRVENLGKKYKIGGAKKASFKESLSHWLKAPFSDNHPTIAPQHEAVGINGTLLNTHGEFWALKDINFEIKKGEAVGIIGRNGAGKSTLLKILSRITKPTTGRYEVFGRVSSLLEVGTGFHPELTGRENVYLNGTILGMKRAEVKAKFDEIVAFSGVEKFLDTPVKHYSSGMKVRLAFAVAAHLEPEILIIDEVLAVGDAEFQRKCLGKMEEVTGQGRTVLFVSHNLTAVKNLCNYGIYLQQGKIKFLGEINHTVEHYFKNLTSKQVTVPLSQRNDRKGNGLVKIIEVNFCRDLYSIEKNNIIAGKTAYIVLDVETKDSTLLKGKAISFAIIFSDKNNNVLFTAHTRFKKHFFEDLPANSKVVCEIPSFTLVPATYNITIRAIVGDKSGRNGETSDHIENAAKLEVFKDDYYGSGELPIESKHGHYLIDHNWFLHKTEEKNVS